MTLLPIISPWVFWPVALILLAGAGYLLFKDRSMSRLRYALLVLFVVLAGARPGVGGAPAQVANTDLNVYFVVDVTPSSFAEDWNGSQTRLAGMKEDIQALAQELSGARFSLITFDTAAKVVLPLTTDTTALKTLTDVLTPRSTFNSKGSSISVAREVLAQKLADSAQSHPERPRLVYYLGDGEQTAPTAPESFAEAAKFTDGGAVLGYGTEAGGRMRESSYSGKPGPYIKDKSKDYADALSTIDEAALTAIATALKVPYVHREAPGQLSGALSKSAPKAAASPQLQEDKDGAGRWEFYWLLALAAFGTALWEIAALTVTWRQLPPRNKEGGA